MTEKRCCSFTGHREIPTKDADRIRRCTEAYIDQVIEDGVTEFITGGAMGYDLLCAELVLKKRAENTALRLIVAVPCPEQARYYREADKARYRKVLKEADEVVTVSDSYYRGCMHKRNRYMVDRSEVVIAYCIKTEGGTYYTRCYALEKGKQLLDVGGTTEFLMLS